MDKLEQFQTASVKFFKKTWAELQKHWRLSVIGGLALVFLMLLVTVVIPSVQRNIRLKETASLIGADFKDNSKVEYVAFDQLEATIRGHEALTVALIDPNDGNYEKFVTALKEPLQMSQYAGKLFVYPMIYQVADVTKTFHLKKGISLIQFEGQREVERTVLTDQNEIELYLVDHLNALQAEKKSEKKKEAKKTKESTETSTKDSSKDSTDTSASTEDEGNAF